VTIPATFPSRMTTALPTPRSVIARAAWNSELSGSIVNRCLIATSRKSVIGGILFHSAREGKPGW
jgi:hypothetical protein